MTARNHHSAIFAPNTKNSNFGGVIVSFGLSVFQISLQLALDVFERKLLGIALNANPWTRLVKEVLDSNLNRLATIERNVVNGLVEVN